MKGGVHRPSVHGRRGQAWDSHPVLSPERHGSFQCPVPGLTPELPRGGGGGRCAGVKLKNPDWLPA